MTAIPLVFTHVLFKDWIARFETRMKAAAIRLILLFQNIKPKQGMKEKERPVAAEREPLSWPVDDALRH
jgi:biopolymer transport protein ExbB